MKIITKEIEKAFAKQGKTGDKSMKDIKIVLKLFNPTGAGTWYLYEKESEDIYWAFVNLGDPMNAECGTVSMSELLAFRGRFGLPLERDMYFEPLSVSLEEVYNTIKAGGHV
ncbi:MAG TPA: DUF2958 domain-containing protein [Lentimicrobium sp.]|nr:DUF2958 domain-containing protein [Lentimicrobium sp.]